MSCSEAEVLRSRVSEMAKAKPKNKGGRPPKRKRKEYSATDVSAIFAKHPSKYELGNMSVVDIGFLITDWIMENIA
ncbi:zinc finger and btb domain-containing protein 24 isoform x1 [Lasius niger]|uniref:Zinc finger and btb domain-containing protein 24 isoform x1 n=1 Tax=Lasius niger TaxID=67767 RepID=A0A0J7K7S9_LASNI|nr:zinc finger and btb domain-containing protein 24 isoform x1 [Lasius niger]